MAEADNSSSEQVPLPSSVELLIGTICNDQKQSPLRGDSRQILASLGEQEALNLLRIISAQQIRVSFDGFIACLARKLTEKDQSASSSSFYSPNKQHCLSMSPQQQQNRSPITPTWLMTNPPPPSANLSPITPIRLMMNSPSDFGVHSPNPMQQKLRGFNMSPRTASGSTISPQLVALGELEFRKAFLILSYLGGRSLEEVLSADQIRGFKDLTMDVFEHEIWNAFGWECGYIKHQDRFKHRDSEETHNYVCQVYPDGGYKFKGPNLTTTQNFLQRTLGDDNILMVKFEEEVTDERSPVRNSAYHYSLKYKRILKEGILVGLRRYHFFVFKAGGKKKDPTTSPVNCIFIRMDSDASIDKQDYVLCGKTVRQARALFMHVDNLSSLSNYMARFSLILSRTLNLEIDLSSVDIEMIPDEQCQDQDGNVVYDKDGKARIHTDGTGFISCDLAMKCPKDVFKGNRKNTSSVERLFEERDLESHHGEPPLLIQCRLYENGRAVKGTFLVNKKLRPRTIHVRPSMIKVEKDPKLLNSFTINSLEVCGTSNKPKRAHLSKNFIALLSYGGVPAKFFTGLLDDSLDNSCRVLSDPLAAMRVALNSGKMDNNFVIEMILSGIPLEEPYLRYRLSSLTEEKKSLQGGKIPVPESYYLMGTVDPTGLLESDEVCIILDNGHLEYSIRILSHFGDIHVLKATYVKALEDFVGYAKYAIFFPCKGPRSLADEMAGGDFDGDMFFVSRNSELLDTFKQREPCPPSSMYTVPSKKKSPGVLSDEKLEEDLFELFFSTRFKASYTMSEAATNWLATMDQLLTLGADCTEEKARLENNILQLIDIYYNALDAPKKGGAEITVPPRLKAKKFPHYMEKKKELSYVSSSILGIIYDKVKSYEEMIRSTIEVTTHRCFKAKVRESCLVKWQKLYQQYRMEMRNALEHNNNNKDSKEEAAEKVIKKYKEELYGAAEFNMSKRSDEDIFEEALAIYQHVYEYAKENGIEKCSFAWKVAGSALCEFYSKSQGESGRIRCSPSALKAILQYRK